MRAVPMPPRVLMGLLLAALLAPPVSAESGVTLPYPTRTGLVLATAFSEDGQPAGTAHVGMDRLGSGEFRIVSRAGQPHGARMQAMALLRPVEPGHSLRPIRQESRSFDRDGIPLGSLVIDHLSSVARCADGKGRLVKEVALPERDRVMNVPMNLFFQPLVRGEQETLRFQLFLCRDGARLLDFEAWVEPRNDPDAPIQVRYGPDLGVLVSTLARQITPRRTFWFDPAAPQVWQGHRLPLYTGGPEVFVVREGITPDWLY